MRFESNKHPLVAILFAIVTLLLIYSVYTSFKIVGPVGLVINFIISASVITFLWSFWIITYYEINKRVLSYRSSLFNGKISIDNIIRIETNTTMWVGLKPALDIRGVIIYYNDYDSIYFSPKNQEGFCSKLIELNPGIKIVDRKV